MVGRRLRRELGPGVSGIGRVRAPRLPAEAGPRGPDRMIVRGALGVARPLRPVIGSRRSVGRRRVRRGAALVWRSRALRQISAPPRLARDPKWALTVNLFVKALLGLREA